MHYEDKLCTFYVYLKDFFASKCIIHVPILALTSYLTCIVDAFSHTYVFAQDRASSWKVCCLNPGGNRLVVGLKKRILPVPPQPVCDRAMTREQHDPV